jgi:hypothetical protein
VQLFTTIPINFSAIEYHINLAQTVIGECVTKQELQSELYCQLIRQTNRHPEPDSSQASQCWMLLALSCPIFLPQQKHLWYFKHYLQRHASMRWAIQHVQFSVTDLFNCSLDLLLSDMLFIASIVLSEQSLMVPERADHHEWRLFAEYLRHHIVCMSVWL